MARTPLAGTLQQIAAEVAAEGQDARRPTRRQLLAGGAGAAAIAAASRFAPAARAAGSPRIVVVGGGLAGLSCAYRLKQAGYTAQVHEAADRVGGRCWTIRGAFADGQIAEHGGELIDQGHTAVRQLAGQLGLKLTNLLSAERNGTEATYYFDGKPYSVAQATSDLKAIWQQVHSDVSAASYPTLYNLSTERGRELDNMSIADYIAAYVPGGRASNLGQLLDVAYNIEYGGETTDQSSLNMLYLLGYSGQGQLRIFGPSNEKYHVVGGNDQIPDRLEDALQGQITMGSELVAIRRNSDGSWGLSFRQGLTTRSVTADRVVMAIPFSILRSSVDFSKAGFSPRKVTAIRQQGMGTNSKLHVQFTSRHWSRSSRTGRPTPTRATRTPGTSRAARAAPPASSWTTRAARSERASAAARRPRGHSSSWARSSRCSPESRGASTVARRSTTGRATPGRRARTRTGRWASTRHSPALSVRSRAAPATSPASTRRWTSRAT